MASRVTYGRLRAVLTELGFKETRRKKGLALELKKADILFLFRPYKANDRIQEGEMFMVRSLLDHRGIMEPDELEELLTKVPAG